MKKNRIIPVMAFVISACTMNETTPVVPQEVRGYEISGGFEQTKTSFENLSGTTAAILWSLNDQIGIFSAENPNAMARLEDACDGKSQGIFIPKDAIPEGKDVPVTFKYPESGVSEFVVYYPYRNDAVMDGNVISSSVPSSQSQSSLGDRSVGRYGFSYGITNVSAEEMKVNFSLEHAMAYLCIRARYAENPGYQLHSVQIMDQTGNYALSGKFHFNKNDKTIAVDEAKGEYSAKVEVENHDFSSTPEAEELYLTVIPGNYSKAAFTVIVSFINKDGSVITVPLDTKKGWNFKAGAISVLDLGEIHKSDCSLPWYEIEETRDLVGGWAYGPENTYFIESKSPGGGSTFITIDVKARGDFSKVAEPVYYGLVTLGGEHKSYSAFLILPDGSSNQDNFDVGRNQFVPYEGHKLGPNYTLTLGGLDQSKATGTFAVVAIYDKDKNLIWSYMLQRYRDYDPPLDVDYPAIGVKMLDRNLGQANGNANLAGNLNSYGAFFQWGRKDPFGFVENGVPNWGKVSTPADASLENAIRHPNNIFLSTADQPNWMGGEINKGLWGGKVNTSDWYDPDYVGHKTIYDPCPAGYRVPDTRVLYEVYTKSARWERTSVIQKYHSGADPKYTHDTGWGGSELAYPTGATTDFWIYAGYNYDSGSRVRTSSDSGYSYWSNAISPTDGRPSCIYGYYVTDWGGANTVSPCASMCVRCQKID